MNQNSSAIFSLIVGAVIMFLVSVAAYFIGGKMAEMFILVDAQNAGIQPPTLTDWKDIYYYLVQDTGVAIGIVLLLWTALTHWGLRSESSADQGKLWLWLLFGIIVASICVASPFLYQAVYSQNIPFDGALIIDKRIIVLFCICFGLLGYWGGSIIVTADKYKYTPLLAHFFR